ncbi:hypothetical protein HanRHA438_Chr09g0386421 [Helianthus annuus]|nr:hypothetical protein HanRHA438_Chr09g0386421 [Helianthus annuus]
MLCFVVNNKNWLFGHIPKLIESKFVFPFVLNYKNLVQFSLLKKKKSSRIIDFPQFSYLLTCDPKLVARKRVRKKLRKLINWIVNHLIFTIFYI